MKNLKKVSLFVLALITCALSDTYAQSSFGEIKGRIFDKETIEPLYGATVHVEVGDKVVGTTTDFDGRFTLKPLEPGTYNVKINYVGYGSQEHSGVIVNSDKISWLKGIQLAQGVELKDVEIIAYKVPLIKPEDPSAVTIGGNEVKGSPSRLNPAAMVQASSSDIKLGDDGQSLFIRGARPDANGYIVDGVKVRSLGSLPASSVKSFTVYTGGVPAKYGDLTGGAVIVESRTYFDMWREWKAQEDAKAEARERKRREALLNEE